MTNKIIILLICSMTLIAGCQDLTQPPAVSRPQQSIMLNYVPRPGKIDFTNNRATGWRIANVPLCCEINFYDLSLIFDTPLRETVTGFQIRNEDATVCIASFSRAQNMIKALSLMPPGTYSIALVVRDYYLIGNITLEEEQE